MPKRLSLKPEEVEKYRKSKLIDHPDVPVAEKTQRETVPADYRFVFPEFLPDPEYDRRDRVRERLERDDMYRRRMVIEIPEFYVGSIMAVTIADEQTPSKESRFVGICIDRGGIGLRAFFILRNVVDGLGVEIMYEMYDPTVLSIETLLLEKRLDNHLYYLRDAPPEYSTFSFDTEAIPIPKGTAIPVNPLKVKLNPRPWLERWERQDLKGIQELNLPQKFYDRAEIHAEKPWQKHDLMKQYRSNINADDTEQVMKEVHQRKKAIDRENTRRRKEAIFKNKK
ncbi:hypothetical protein LOTGIDRAFT_210367 [Lottia gigantea]|uniref:Large ribosomal subunit protein bL19m n=1 Tax=Lottia gigantea TaxID=225164 RepID=V4A363_LOTGI|nr:hypothetical protein LOTGIDRAFT_210367 [Lottia gigantea]ESO89330.1 hypothetical protein LOTGIDRAFT_210367 [Lottia gigantea]